MLPVPAETFGAGTAHNIIKCVMVSRGTIWIVRIDIQQVCGVISIIIVILIYVGLSVQGFEIIVVIIIIFCRNYIVQLTFQHISA